MKTSFFLIWMIMHKMIVGLGFLRQGLIPFSTHGLSLHYVYYVPENNIELLVLLPSLPISWDYRCENLKKDLACSFFIFIKTGNYFSLLL